MSREKKDPAASGADNTARAVAPQVVLALPGPFQAEDAPARGHCGKCTSQKPAADTVDLRHACHGPGHRIPETHDIQRLLHVGRQFQHGLQGPQGRTAGAIQPVPGS